LRVKRLLVLILLAPVIAGCYASKRAPLNERTDLARVDGVTMRSGRKIEFAVNGATIANDTLRAVGKSGTITIPTDSIAAISQRKFSTAKTVGLTAGISAVVFAAFVVLSLNTIAID
jgi:hypothetical protein